MPFFFKQWGGYPKGRFGRELDRKTYDEMPSREPAPVAATDRRNQHV